MRLVNCIVVHNNKQQLCNITVITRTGHNICLLSNPDKILRYDYASFSDMYKSVLNILKNNDFKTQCVDYENAKLYNIQWIDCNYPCKVSTYFYNEKR